MNRMNGRHNHHFKINTQKNKNDYQKTENVFEIKNATTIKMKFMLYEKMNRNHTTNQQATSEYCIFGQKLCDNFRLSNAHVSCLSCPCPMPMPNVCSHVALMKCSFFSPFFCLFVSDSDSEFFFSFVFE